MKTIVITGPEASGKSDLTLALSKELNAAHVMEYARWYLPTLHRQYQFQDLLAISRGQEREVIKKRYTHWNSDYLIVDTWAVVLMIWAEYKFGKTHPCLHNLLSRHEIHYFLLCAPDLPWAEDPLRENPNDRDELFRLYQEKLEDLNLPYSIIRGQGKERMQRAMQMMEAFT